MLDWKSGNGYQLISGLSAIGSGGITGYGFNNTPIYFSPYAHKKKNFGNLNTEPRKIPLEMNSTSRNKMKQKISNSIIGKNFSNLQSQDAFRKSSKLITETNEKSG